MAFSDCEWAVSFTDDPAICFGYPAGSGTPSQCAAACGVNRVGQVADACWRSSGQLLTGGYQVVCYWTTPPVEARSWTSPDGVAFRQAEVPSPTEPMGI